LPPQVNIFAADFVEKRSACFRRSLQRGVEEFLGSPPTLLLHANSVLYCPKLLSRLQWGQLGSGGRREWLADLSPVRANRVKKASEN
jgi:hypothetical protein